jgi:hypothetical protein
MFWHFKMWSFWIWLIFDFRHLETRNNAMTETRTQTLNRSLSTQSTEKPVMTRSKSLRSSFRLKSRKKKSRKSSLDVSNSNNQEMQEMVLKKNQVTAWPQWWSFEDKSRFLQFFLLNLASFTFFFDFFWLVKKYINSSFKVYFQCQNHLNLKNGSSGEHFL